MSGALVIGASGGIGGALIEVLVARGEHERVIAASRSRPSCLPNGVNWLALDLEDGGTLETADARIGGPLRTVVVVTGMLHDAAAGPERSLRELDADRLARSFAVNAIGPALALRYFTPLLSRNSRSVFACLSARVGSIADNRLGGWYGYRASKAALNQIVPTAAVGLARTRPQAICVALHPGTVDTVLGRPFQRGVGPERLFTPAFAAERLIAVMERLMPKQSGRLFAWDGSAIAP